LRGENVAGGEGGVGRVRVETGALRQAASVAREVADVLRRAAAGPDPGIAGCPGFEVAAVASTTTARWVDHAGVLASAYTAAASVLTDAATAHDRTEGAVTRAFSGVGS